MGLEIRITVYLPIICEKNKTSTLELLLEEIQMKNLDMVSRRPEEEELKKMMAMQSLKYLWWM